MEFEFGEVVGYVVALVIGFLFGKSQMGASKPASKLCGNIGPDGDKCILEKAHDGMHAAERVVQQRVGGKRARYIDEVISVNWE
jgi:hypothetical protein